MFGDDTMWYATCIEDDVNAGHPRIETWDALKKELWDQFLPTNTIGWQEID